METTSIIIITGLVAVATAIILNLSKSSKDLTVTIRMEDTDYPIKNDDVEELKVKPKRKYKKRTPKLPNSKVKLAPKRPVGRPRKTVE